jgi:hypothetical protein
MDALDRVAGAGRDLLGRVDAVLIAHGAPPGHAVLTHLRRLGALPGDVLAAFCALRPAALLAAGAGVRRRAEGCVEERAELAATVDATHWEGDAATSFTARWRSFDAHLGDRADPGQDSLAGRLAATASYVDDVAEWAGDARRGLALALAEALGSLDAVRLRTVGDPGGAVVAAATIGALVLEAAGRQVDAGEAVAARWAGRLGELPFRPVGATPGRSGKATRVAL